MDRRSHWLNRDTALRALELAAPWLDTLARDPSRNQSGVLHVVIMDPLQRRQP